MNSNKNPLSVSNEGIIISIIIALVTAFGAFLLGQNLLQQTPNYPDFIAGAITWEAATKFQDLASYPLFVLGFLVGGLLTHWFFQRVSIVKSSEYNQSLITVIIWWSIPLFIVAGGFLNKYPNTPSAVIYISIAGIISTAIAVIFNLSRNDMLPDQIGLGVLGAILIGFLPYGIATIQDRIPLVSESFRIGVISEIGFLLSIAAIIFFLLACRGSSTFPMLHTARILMLAQIGISPFYLLLIPDLYFISNGKQALYTTPWLWILIISFWIMAIIDVAIKYIKFISNQSTDLTRLLSPLAFFSTIILLKLGSTEIPNIPIDDYHFGESLLGWWSFWEFGKLSYIDYFPPHGIFGDDIGGYISLIFYDGTASSISEADRLLSFMTMLVAFLALVRYTGSVGLAYFSILLYGAVSNKLFFLILIPFICIWLKIFINNSASWLRLWLISALILILLVPPQGLITVFAFSPLVGFHLYRSRTINWKFEITIFIFIFVILAIFTPIPLMLFGAIRYVIENGPINQIAYGIPWSWSWGEATQDKGKTVFFILLELIRMSWICIPILAAALIFFLSKQIERRVYLISVVLPILLFTSLMTPYALGRIDPASASRPGILSSFSWAFLLPILVTPLLAGRGRAVLALSLAFVCSGIGLSSVNQHGFSSILKKDLIQNLWSGSEHGMKNMGAGIINQQHVERLERINDFLSSQLKPRESYLDLTGHNADYMYFDRPPSMSTTAPYNLASIQEQIRIVKRLSNSIPRVALIEADNLNYDGVGPALRAHALYRFVIENYEAGLHDGYVFGVAKNSDLQRIGLNFTIKKFTDQNWENGILRSGNAVIIRDSITVQYLNVGDSITLPDKIIRKITRIWPDGNAIWFDGIPYEPSPSDSQRLVQINLNELSKRILSAQLMNHVFAIADLRKIPLAWGMSDDSLAASMKKVVDLNFSLAFLHDFILKGNSLNIVGPDPYLWLDLSQQKITGNSAGLLKFDVYCENGENPRIQIFWWNDDMEGAAPSQSLLFTAANGTVIVPLDAYPSWLVSKSVKGLRIDLENARACQKFAVKNASLNQRVNF
jgi:hypothetical protein